MAILKDENNKPIKSRTWKIEFYPESAPTDWENLLEEEGLPIAVSPCHDSDIKDDGTPKKPHYHVIVQYPSPTTSGKAQSLAKSLGSNPFAMPSDNLARDFDYLTHKRSKNKHQYNDVDIKILGGFTPPKAYNPTLEKAQKKESASTFDSNLFNFIREHNLGNLGMLVAKLFECGMIDEYLEVKNNSYFWGSICKSLTESPKLVRAYEYLCRVATDAHQAVSLLNESVKSNRQRWRTFTSDEELAIHKADIALEKITTEMENYTKCL